MSTRKGTSRRDRQEFSYKGKTVGISVSEDSGSISIDEHDFAISRGPAGMWSSHGVFNHYADPAALARHIVDYLHLFQPSR